MPSSAEFNWSILDRDGIAKIFWALKPKIVEVPLEITQLHSIISKHIKKHFPVRIKKIVDPKVESGWVYIGGAYYSDYDEDYEKCIEVNFNYSLFDEKITLGTERFKRMCFTLADVLLHEIIHMRQYRRREFKMLPDYESKAERDEQRDEQSYLGCSDEIDAYAFNIACELLDKFPQNQRKAAAYLARKHHKGRLKSHSLRMYLKAFDYNHNHQILRRLKKRTIMYLPKAELGQPYLTKDWINY